MAILKNIEAPLSSSHRNDMGRHQLRTLFSSDNSKNDGGGDHHPYHRRNSEVSSSPNTTSSRYDNYSSYSNPCSTISSPYLMPSPLSQSQSPYYKSPWIYNNEEGVLDDDMNDLLPNYRPIGSLYREEGHIYSIAACGDLLYTGSDSRNIRVWKNMQEFSGFKSSSGLVKAIVVLQDRIFTGHQDGKIRVWRQQHGGGDDDKHRYTRVGTLPTTRDLLMKSMNPKNYVEVRRRKNVPWIKHYDAVSCMCADEERGLLYSGSWDKTLKVWRASDFKCLESIRAHDDAVNAVATAYGGLVFTGSSDGTVKSWRRELAGKTTSHDLDLTLLRQDHAVTSLVVSSRTGIMYAGSSDGLVNFWTRREKHSMSHGGALRGHKLAVLCLAVGGRLVMSGSADNSVCVWGWDAVAGAHSCVAVLTGHGGPVKCLAVSEEEEEKKRMMVFSGSLDNSVKVWRVCEHVPTLLEEELAVKSNTTR